MDTAQEHHADRVKKKQKSDSVEPTVSFFNMFAFADGLDYVLMAAGTLSALAHGATFPIYFIFFGKIVNGFGRYQDKIPQMMQEVQKYALYTFYLGLCVWGTAWAEIACWMYSGERQIGRMRVTYVKAILSQEVSFFDTDARAHRFVESISSDTLLVQDAISEKVGNFLYNMGTFASGFAISLLAVWRLSLVTMATVPAMALAGMLYMRTITRLTSESQAAYGKAGAIAHQAIAQIRTVKAFAGEENTTRSYSEALRVTLKLGYNGGLAKGFGVGATFLIMFWTWALVLWYSSVLIRQGKTNRGSAVTAVFGGMTGGLGLGQALSNLNAFGKGRAAAYKIMELMNRTPKIVHKVAEPTILSVVTGDVELRNVAFSYPSRPDVMVFTDFSLLIPAGKSVALVGSSGSGKSTIVSLLERFYDPNAGQILLDGVDTRSLQLRWLRDQIGLVNQEPALFTTSVLENILYGKQDATMQEVEEAVRVANADAFIRELPDAYNTQVGERGVQLSGGQKQRVAIARAILKNPKIILLDEATSALDSASERTVQEALDQTMVGRTSVVIAHRLSTIRCVDSIAVVQEGRIFEIGTHDELIAKGGSYATLFRLPQSVSLAKGGDELPCDEGGSCPTSIDRTTSTTPCPSTSTVFDLEKETPAPDHRYREAQSVAIGTSTSFWRLVRLNAPEWSYAMLGTIGAVLCGIPSPLFALLLSKMLQVFYFTDLRKMDREIHKLSLIFVCVGTIIPGTYILQHYFFGIAGENLTVRIREMMFKSILANEVGWFDEDKNNSTRLAARLATDATQVRAAVGDRVSLVVQNMTVFTTSCVIALVLQWQMALVVLAACPLLLGASVSQLLLARGFAGDLRSAHAKGSMIAGEAVSNIRTVAAFNAEANAAELVAREQRAPVRRSVLRGNVAGCAVGAAQMTLFASYGLALWFGGKLVERGAATFGRVMEAFLVEVFMAMAVAETLALTPDVAKADTAVSSVFEILDRKSTIFATNATAPSLPSVNGEIELRNVHFAYPTRPSISVFQNLSLHVTAGQSLALVGSSGCGKSSVLALLLRFYDPTSGSVMIDGRDLTAVNVHSLRHYVGLVPQEPALFTCSIHDNILLGRPGASEAEIHAAAQAAHAHRFISSLPNGYNTEVGDRGVQLSGGQRQRVAIARAVLKDPAILLLDEATSALDVESEEAVNAALEQLIQRRTTVLVAHHFSSIRHVSKIAVIQGGRVVQEGSHPHLLEDRSGPYVRLYNLQVFPRTDIPHPPP